jgi:hypothetical protein
VKEIKITVVELDQTGAKIAEDVTTKHIQKLQLKWYFVIDLRNKIEHRLMETQ